MRRRFFYRFLSVLPALCLFGAAPSQSSAEVVDRIVAIVNESVVTLSELNAATAVALDKIAPDAKKDGKGIVELKGKVLDSIIEQKLVKQAADSAGIEISEREVDNAIEDVKKQNEMTEDALMLALAQNGLTYREYREQLKEQIRQVKFIGKEFRSKISIQNEEIEDYYRQNQDEFAGPASYRVRMIFVPSNNADLMNRKIGIVKDGLKAGMEFARLAAEYSDGPEAGAGGDLGYVKSGELDKAIEEAVKRLSINEISEPVFLPEGVYFLQLLDSKAPEPRPLAEVGKEIQEKLFKKMMDERFAFWLKEVKTFAHIEMRL